MGNAARMTLDDVALGSGTPRAPLLGVSSNMSLPSIIIGLEVTSTHDGSRRSQPNRSSSLHTKAAYCTPSPIAAWHESEAVCDDTAGSITVRGSSSSVGMREASVLALVRSGS